MSTDPTNGEPSRDAAFWAPAVSRLSVPETPPGATNLNVDGHEVLGALQGFGQMWRKTYQVRLEGLSASAAEVMTTWKEHFASFQPADNHFYPSLRGIQPGETMLIDSSLPVVKGLPGLIPLASGVMVLYADDTSFSVMTPQGFPEAGWNTFSVFDDEGCLVAQVQSLARATDPVYEFGFRFMGGSQHQEMTWRHVLTSLAAHLGVEGAVEMRKECVDPRLQWPHARNVFHNAGIRTMLYRLAAPLRWLRSLGQPHEAG